MGVQADRKSVAVGRRCAANVKECEPLAAASRPDGGAFSRRQGGRAARAGLYCGRPVCLQNRDSPTRPRSVQVRGLSRDGPTAG